MRNIIVDNGLKLYNNSSWKQWQALILEYTWCWLSGFQEDFVAIGSCHNRNIRNTFIQKLVLKKDCMQ